MWIDNRMSKPLRKGFYRTLVSTDDFTLEEAKRDLFNGESWDLYASNSQFIRYWWAEKEDYQIISEFIEKEREEYYKQLDEASKNFGGL